VSTTPRPRCAPRAYARRRPRVADTPVFRGTMAGKINPLDMVGSVAMSVAAGVAQGVGSAVAQGAKAMASGEAHFFDESITVRGRRPAAARGTR
jgi:hypothetical protein